MSTVIIGVSLLLYDLFLVQHGISWLTTSPYTPEQNGTSERRHRHIVETGCTLLLSAGLPTAFWTYAFEAAAFLINRLPTPLLCNRSPYECLFGQTPNYSKLRVFGCMCFPLLQHRAISSCILNPGCVYFLGIPPRRVPTNVMISLMGK